FDVSGSATDTTVYAGGREVVENGGTAAGTTISGGTMEVASGGSAGGSISFATDSGTLQIDASTTGNLLPGTTISGFVSGDTIDLASIKNVAGSLAVMNPVTDVLTVTEGTQTYTLDFSGNFVGDLFQLTADNGGAGPGTDITEETPCYCPGTLIRTPCGNKRIEKLQIGDEVMTASGAARPIKWIGRRSYGGRFVMGRKDILPICIKAGALADNVPKRDLWISPNHAMYFEDADGGALIEAKDLVNGVSIVQAERADKVEYVHIELESHDIIIAEGALAESFIDDDDRFMFHNAHEYRVLYPTAATALAQYCAPRLDGGYELEAVRQRLAARAGLESRDHPAGGVLHGFVDRITPHVIEGWAQNAEHPEAPVCLDIYAVGRLIGQVLANRHREDLKRAGIGSGCHSFAFTPPPGLALLPVAVEVRRSLDGAMLNRALRAAA
ncbi:MAG: Hint domain-containing protein, partial [Xanthobacteraceae bacterium]